jgi:Uma2 family endonuclease
LPLAPDLVAEVISPHDRSRDVESKTQAWLDAGVNVVLVVDPQASRVRVCRPASAPKDHTDGFVDLNDILPGFQLDVAELFA